MKKTLKLICCLLALTACGGCVPISQSTKEGAYAPQLNPYVGGFSSTESDVLYYPLEGEQYLAGISSKVQIPSGESAEAALVKALIDGPDTGSDLVSAFWDGVRLVSVTNDGKTLYVTFSQELLSPPSDVSDKPAAIRTAVYSAVNTLTARGDFSSVQILVDEDGSGKGKRPTREAVGLEGDAALEPLTFDNDVLLTPSAVVGLLISAAIDEDYERLYRTLEHGEGDTLRPEATRLAQMAKEASGWAESYNIMEETRTEAGTSATVTADVVQRFKDGTSTEMYNASIKTVLDEGVWKVVFSSVENVLFPD